MNKRLLLIIPFALCAGLILSCNLTFLYELFSILVFITLVYFFIHESELPLLTLPFGSSIEILDNLIILIFLLCTFNTFDNLLCIPQAPLMKSTLLIHALFVQRHNRERRLKILVYIACKCRLGQRRCIDYIFLYWLCHG